MRSARSIGWGGALGGLILVALASALPAAEPQAQPKTEDVKQAAQVPIAVPEAEKLRKNTRMPTEQSVDFGKLLFSSQCAMCHGASGNGRGELAVKYGFKMPDFTGTALQKRRTDGEWFYIMTKGHGKMPGIGARFSDSNKWDLVNYLRTLDD